MTQPSGDRELAARCRAGDAEAWRQVYERHVDFVWRVARRLGMDAEEAQDVVQDVFMVVYRRIGDFEDGRLSTWLYRICANVVSDRHRRRRVRQAFRGLLEGLGLAPKALPSQQAVVERASAQRAVARILAKMSPNKREVFTLYELEGAPGDVIAERLGCPVGTVWTRLHHARREFLRIGKRLAILEEDA